ncbi:MAG: trigger factor [Oscillospiraceae bacterium]|jgi:trigger factor|nr:trigger factor [Oscillospiraceae bacterium]
MALKAVEKDEKQLVTLTIEVSAEAFEEAVQQAYRRGAGRFNVPGFRRGKAPRKMVETLYGPSVFYEDAVKASYPDAYEQAVEEAGVEPVEQADIEILEIGPEGYSFKARIHVRPEAEVGQYKGLTAFKPPVAVSDEAVESELARMRARNARLVSVDRPAKDGDTVTIDYEGFVDGVPFEGGKGENTRLVLGSNRFIPGFEAQLTGCAAGEDVSVAVTFPEEYHAPELAGREAAFAVHVHEVKESEEPELDDEFAKDVSEFDTLEALRADIRAKLTEQHERASNEAYEDAIVDKLVAETRVEIPDAMVEEEAGAMLERMQGNLSSHGMNLDTYLSILGQTFETLCDELRVKARRRITADLACEKIAVLEQLEVSEEKMNAEYETLAAQVGKTVEEIKRVIDEKALHRRLLVREARAVVVATAVAATTVDEVDGVDGVDGGDGVVDGGDGVGEAAEAAAPKKTVRRKAAKKDQDVPPEAPEDK